MKSALDFGALLKNHLAKHKARPTQFTSVASGVQKRRNDCVRNRRNTRSTIVDCMRNIPQNYVPIEQVKLDSRRDKLEKWKQEKEKKRKEVESRKKTPFITGVVHPPLQYVPPPPLQKPMPSTSGRVTRSQATKKTTVHRSANGKDNNKSSTKSFAPENASFRPPKLKMNKTATFVPIKVNEKTKKATQNFMFNPVIPQKIEQLHQPNSKVSKSKFTKHVETKEAKENSRATRKVVQNSKSKSSESEDKANEESNIKTPKVKRNTKRKSLRGQTVDQISNNAELLQKVPKSESSSEEKLRSPSEPNVELINLVSPVKTPPQVTVARGKDKARQEMKIKIKEGIFEEDASDMENVQYIRNQYESEMERIAGMCTKWEEISQETELPENVHDLVLAAVGQSRLLMSKKLQQFASLLARCENPSPDSALVTPADLQGFWDTIYMQIENIDMRFKKLEELKANDWVEKQIIEKKKVNKIVKPKGPVVNTNGPSRMREFIAAARKAKKGTDTQPTPVIPNGAENAETKTFNAGFFAVNSPVKRSPVGLGTPSGKTNLLKTVLSSEAKKSVKKDNASYAMLRASILSKDIEFEGIMLLPQTPPPEINLQATPGRSILKSGVKSGNKKLCIKFLESPTELNKSNDQEISITDLPDVKENINLKTETKEINMIDKENYRTSKLIRQDATEFSPIATRSQRRRLSVIQTPNLPEQIQETLKMSNRKRGGLKTNENIEGTHTKKRSARKEKLIEDLQAGLEEISLETPRRSMRIRKSLAMS